MDDIEDSSFDLEPLVPPEGIVDLLEDMSSDEGIDLFMIWCLNPRLSIWQNIQSSQYLAEHCIIVVERLNRVLDVTTREQMRQ